MIRTGISSRLEPNSRPTLQYKHCLMMIIVHGSTKSRYMPGLFVEAAVYVLIVACNTHELNKYIDISHVCQNISDVLKFN